MESQSARSKVGHGCKSVAMSFRFTLLGCRHFGDAVVEKWAAIAGESIHRAGHGADLNYDSATANTYLKHMHEDQTLQAILRFGRDQEGAVVFAHTTALSESLPIVADGAVVKAFSKSKQAVTRAARKYRGLHRLRRSPVCYYLHSWFN